MSCFDSGFPVVRVWAIAVTSLRSSAKLLREINDVNARTRTVHVYYDDGLVCVEQTLHANGVNVQTLGQQFGARRSPTVGRRPTTTCDGGRRRAFSCSTGLDDAPVFG